MPIVDFWNNPIAPATLQLVGYRGGGQEFPHDLYSFLLSSLREADQKETALLWRFLQPMQTAWESIYSSSFAVLNLLSAEDCPSEYLDHLRKMVGILDDLAYLWRELTESEQRRLIQYFTRFCRYRGTDLGFIEMLQTMTGQNVVLRDYFYYRWIVSGDYRSQRETALSEDLEGHDPWAISEADVIVGLYPDSVSLIPYGAEYGYRFVVNSLVARTPNPPVGEFVIVRYASKNVWTKSPLKWDGADYFLELPVGYYFGQTVESLPQSVYMFLVGAEPDPYVSDILIEQGGTLTRQAIKGLVRFSRPMSERIYIRYYLIIEGFPNLDRWSLVSGLAIAVEGEVTLGDTTATLLICSKDGADAWENYCAGWRAQSTIVSKAMDLVFMRQSATDYYYVRVVPNPPPTLPAGSWELHQVVSSVDTTLFSGDLDQFDLEVDYYWRVECFVSPWPGGDVQLIRFYQDEVEVFDVVDNPAPWGGAVGTVGIGVEADGEVIVSRVEVHPLPMESDLVALN